MEIDILGIDLAEQVFQRLCRTNKWAVEFRRFKVGHE
ncbi:hypothetical protein SBC2_76200 (plasmid) [Caballeronia sp. SBC2]|nr:hypothetical protein SBC2_76200 [Caballeronia sp. SBC2]